MTGVKKIENGKKSVQILIDYIKEIYKIHPEILKEKISVGISFSGNCPGP